MGTSAIIMMILFILVIWGGLALAILNLSKRSPENPGPSTEFPPHEL